MRTNVLTLILILLTGLTCGYVRGQASQRQADTAYTDTVAENSGHSTALAIKSIKSGVTEVMRDQRFVKNTVVPVIIAVVTGLIAIMLLILFLVFRRRQKRKLRYHEQQAREAKLRLQSIRSQLNPHFVYNALAGIQNLLNKKDNDAANTYLTKFSRLSRRVLDDADKDLIPLSDEVGLLDDYLQMEQFRFGFSYGITVDDEIDANNTEIPGMLVQPFVENAVKHGIVSFKNGDIRIRFEKSDLSIVVAIEDNGVGFDPVAQKDGAGLGLSKNRIALLNEVYRHTPVSLQVKSGETGTKIKIILKDWLA